MKVIDSSCSSIFRIRLYVFKKLRYVLMHRLVGDARDTCNCRTCLMCLVEDMEIGIAWPYCMCDYVQEARGSIYIFVIDSFVLLCTINLPRYIEICYQVPPGSNGRCMSPKVRAATIQEDIASRNEMVSDQSLPIQIHWQISRKLRL